MAESPLTYKAIILCQRNRETGRNLGILSARLCVKLEVKSLDLNLI